MTARTELEGLTSDELDRARMRLAFDARYDREAREELAEFEREIQRRRTAREKRRKRCQNDSTAW